MKIEKALTIADRIFKAVDKRRIKDPGLASVAADARADLLSAEANELDARSRKTRHPHSTRLARRAERLFRRAGWWRRRADRLRVKAKEEEGKGW